MTPEFARYLLPGNLFLSGIAPQNRPQPDGIFPDFNFLLSSVAIPGRLFQ